MNANKIDVLAVIAEAVAHLEHDNVMGTPQRALVAPLCEACAAVAELIEAAAEMNRLAKGPAGGVSQAEKRAIVDRMDAALAGARGEADGGAESVTLGERLMPGCSCGAAARGDFNRCRCD